MAKPYKLMKDGGALNVRDRETNELVGTVSGSDNSWDVELFGTDFHAKSKAKALGFIRGVFAARTMVNDVFSA